MNGSNRSAPFVPWPQHLDLIAVYTVPAPSKSRQRGVWGRRPYPTPPLMRSTSASSRRGCELLQLWKLNGLRHRFGPGSVNHSVEHREDEEGQERGGYDSADDDGS